MLFAPIGIRVQYQGQTCITAYSVETLHVRYYQQHYGTINGINILYNISSPKLTKDAYNNQIISVRK